LRSLYVRVWLTVVAVLALFALASGWVFQRQVEQERGRFDAIVNERTAAWGELIQRSLPGPDASVAEQASALQEWSQRLRMPLALDAADGARIADSDSYRRRLQDDDRGAPSRAVAIKLDDGRTLRLLRGPARGVRGEGGPGRDAVAKLAFGPAWWRGPGLVLVLVLLFVAIALGAFPVVRRLTRRLEALKQGVERFGAGALNQRVDDGGRDEVAAVASSFNRAAERIELLVQSHRSLLANASHELRSPLARLKMAVTMLDAAAPDARAKLQAEIETNIRELDALVEEVLLASRLDAREAPLARETIDLVALAAEEAARVRADLDSGVATLSVSGDERLLRRALRNLLENARRYGGDGEVTVQLATPGSGVEIRVCDRGPGVVETMRERIFEPFFRLPGHAEREGGIGLGLSLVRQIAERHGGSVRCTARSDSASGSCFVLSLPAAGASRAA
jgi:signal transduction histidine kinase